MFCEQCGNNIDNGAAFCSVCGKKVNLNIADRQVFKDVIDNMQSPGSMNSTYNVQNSPFMSPESAPTAQNSPFMSPEPAPTAQNSPFMSPEPAPTAQNSPFMSPEPAPATSNSSFMNNAGPKLGNMTNPFGAETNRSVAPAVNYQEVPPVDKSSKAEKKAKKSKDSSQGSKIFLMVFAQIIFIGIICFLGFTGKLNNSLGEINLGFTIVLLGVIMAINVLLYMMLFTSKKKVILTPPPVEQPITNINRSTPSYMSEVMGGIPDLYAEDENDDCPTEVEIPVGYENYDDDEATVVIDVSAPKFAKLEYVEDGITREILINKNEFVIGRLRDRVDFITANKKIGRIHAAILTKDNGYFVKDFNSQNKTYINRGGAISPEQEYQIYNNDIISFADSEFVFKLPE